jgi:DNA-binding transcriptional MerR regulator
MLHIGDLSHRTGVSAQTIRYYESIGVLPEPDRADNGYRLYDQEDVERLRFIRSARALDFALDDIQEILDLRDQGTAPCRYVMALMQEQVALIDNRMRALERLRDELIRLHKRGLQMPEDVRMKDCVCHLIEARPEQDETMRA